MLPACNKNNNKASAKLLNITVENINLKPQKVRVFREVYFNKLSYVKTMKWEPVIGLKVLSKNLRNLTGKLSSGGFALQIYLDKIVLVWGIRIMHGCFFWNINNSRPSCLYVVPLVLYLRLHKIISFEQDSWRKINMALENVNFGTHIATKITKLSHYANKLR